jgi:hypothetical protein
MEEPFFPAIHRMRRLSGKSSRKSVFTRTKVERNPVRARMVRQTERYLWSSAGTQRDAHRSDIRPIGEAGNGRFLTRNGISHIGRSMIMVVPSGLLGSART